MESQTSFTILAVDDHPDMLRLIKAALPEYNLITAESGEEALRILLHDHADLILLDIMMSGMDGLETAARIRQRRETADIPIIFISAIDRTDQKVFMGYEAGAVDYIFKPFDPAILRAKVSVFARLFEKTEKLRRSEAELVRINQKLIDTNVRLDTMNKDLMKEIEERKRTEERLASLSSELLLAQEKERRRISYDLHDHVWQSLGLIEIDMGLLFSERNPAAFHRRSKKITSLIRETVARIRSIQGDLWPFVLDDVGLLATISWYCREFEKNHSGLSIERHVDLVEDEIPSLAKIVIYRVMQEAMNNVAKHSQASRVSLSLIKNDHRLEFRVEDNGIGFDPEEMILKRSPWGGMGLLSMKERTELSGGLFGVESVRGRGTTVRASWPVASSCR